jgi:hypothetical protein
MPFTCGPNPGRSRLRDAPRLQSTGAETFVADRRVPEACSNCTRLPVLVPSTQVLVPSTVAPRGNDLILQQQLSLDPNALICTLETTVGKALGEVQSVHPFLVSRPKMLHKRPLESLFG